MYWNLIINEVRVTPHMFSLVPLEDLYIPLAVPVEEQPGARDPELRP